LRDYIIYENIRDGFKLIEIDHELIISTARDLAGKESINLLLEKND
jgi:hypothetical protein